MSLSFSPCQTAKIHSNHLHPNSETTISAHDNSHFRHPSRAYVFTNGFCCVCKQERERESRRKQRDETENESTERKLRAKRMDIVGKKSSGCVIEGWGVAIE